MAESSQVNITIKATDQASSVFGKVGSSAANLGKTLAVGIAGAGAAVAAGLGAAIKVASDFEAQMSAVKAVSGATAPEMAQLSQKALQLGKDMSFSATEAGAGIEELVKAGVSVPDIMSGAADATLALAEAGGVDLKTAAEVAANALNTFNLSGEDMGRVTDAIAGAANNSAIDVNDFRLSMASAGAAVKLAGGDFDDLAVAITAMGNAGIKGSDAGTSLKTMLLNLNPATERQKNLMRDLGIVTADGSNKFFDAQGKMRSFADVSQVLQDALRGQTDQQKLATLETLFGSDAIRAASVLAAEGAEGFNALAEKVLRQGQAAEAASARLDNLQGDLKRLSGSVEVAGITLGQAFQQPLREVVQALDGFITSNLIPFIETHGPAFAAAVTTAGKSLVEGTGSLLGSIKTITEQGLADLAGKLVETGPKIAEWVAGSGEWGKAAEKGLNAAGLGIQAVQLALGGEFPGAMTTGKKSFEELGGAAEAAASGIQRTREELEKLPSASSAARDLAKAAEQIGLAWADVQRVIPPAIGNLLGLGGAAKDAAGGAGEASGGFRIFGETVDTWLGRIPIAPLLHFANSVRNAAGAIAFLGDAANAISATFQRIWPQIQADAAEFAADVGRLFSNLGSTLESWRANAVATFLGMVQGWHQAGAELSTSVGATFDQLGTTISTGLTNTLSAVESWRAGLVAAFLQAVADASTAVTTLEANIQATLSGLIGTATAQAVAIGSGIVSGLVSGITGRANEVATAARNLVTNAINAARAALESGSPSRVFMEIGEGTGEGLALGIEAGIPDAEAAAADLADSVTEAATAELETGQVEVTRAAVDLGQSVADALAVGLGKVKTVEAAADALKGTVAGAMRDLAGEIDRLNSDTERKFGEIGAKTARAVQDAIRDASRQIADTIADTSDRITDLRAQFAEARQLRGVREGLRSRQDEVAQARSRAREIEDIQRERRLEDADAERQLAEDLADAKTDEERNGILERHAEAQEDRARQRREEDAELAYRRQREDEDRQFRKDQEAETRAFEDNLDEEALDKSIARAEEERDARIRAINEALAQKKQKIEEDSRAETDKLAAASAERIQTLKDEFVGKLPEITGDAQGVVETFLAGLDQALTSTTVAAQSAALAIQSIVTSGGVTTGIADLTGGLGGVATAAPAAAGALSAFDQAVQAAGPDITALSELLGITDLAVEEFAHQFGVSWDAARETLVAAGLEAHEVLGVQFPTHADTAEMAAKDLLTQTQQTVTDGINVMNRDTVTLTDSTKALTPRLDAATNATDALGGTMGDVATNQATQISAVLLQLRDGLLGTGAYAGQPGLIQAVRDFIDALNDIPRQVDIHVVTHYSSTGSSGGGGGGGDGGGGGGDGGAPAGWTPGASGPGGIWNDPSTGEPRQEWPEGMQHGGRAMANKPYLVGEVGPELFVPDRAGTVVPNHALGGGNVYVTVNVHGSVTAEADLAENIRRLLLQTGRRNVDIFGGLA